MLDVGLVGGWSTALVWNDLKYNQMDCQEIWYIHSPQRVNPTDFLNCYQQVKVFTSSCISQHFAKLGADILEVLGRRILTLGPDFSSSTATSFTFVVLMKCLFGAFIFPPSGALAISSKHHCAYKCGLTQPHRRRGRRLSVFFNSKV